MASTVGSLATALVDWPRAGRGVHWAEAGVMVKVRSATHNVSSACGVRTLALQVGTSKNHNIVPPAKAGA